VKWENGEGEEKKEGGEEYFRGQDFRGSVPRDYKGGGREMSAFLELLTPPQTRIANTAMLASYESSQHC